MRYRQWKKKYNKKHGCNPPLEVDKRKQAKVVRKALNVDVADILKIGKELADIGYNACIDELLGGEHGK